MTLTLTSSAARLSVPVSTEPPSWPSRVHIWRRLLHVARAAQQICCTSIERHGVHFQHTEQRPGHDYIATALADY